MKAARSKRRKVNPLPFVIATPAGNIPQSKGNSLSRGACAGRRGSLVLGGRSYTLEQFRGIRYGTLGIRGLVKVLGSF